MHKEGRKWDEDKTDKDFDWSTDIAEISKCSSQCQDSFDKVKLQGDDNDKLFFTMYQEHIDVIASFANLESKANENSSQEMINFCTKYRPYH